MKPYYERDGIVIYHGDCREILPSIGKVDLVLTDPPYGIGDKWARGEMHGKNGRSRLWGKGETWDDAVLKPELIASAIGAGRHAIVWGGNYFNVEPARQWLIWDKVQKFSGSDAEMAWTNLPGTVRVFRLSRIDAYVNNAEFRKSHPTEKPEQLMRWCIKLAGDSTGTILDPFMGTGTTLRAAKSTARTAIGIEIEERYCEVAAKRLDATTRQMFPDPPQKAEQGTLL